MKDHEGINQLLIYPERPAQNLLTFRTPSRKGLLEPGLSSSSLPAIFARVGTNLAQRPPLPAPVVSTKKWCDPECPRVLKKNLVSCHGDATCPPLREACNTACHPTKLEKKELFQLYNYMD